MNTSLKQQTRVHSVSDPQHQKTPVLIWDFVIKNSKQNFPSTIKQQEQYIITIALVILMQIQPIKSVFCKVCFENT